MAEALARRLEAPEDPFVDVLAVHDRIEAILVAPTSLQVVHQPIVTVASMEPVGWEALARFPGPAPEPPDVWFADAHTVGLGIELELLAASRAVETMDSVPPGAFLSINLSGGALGSPGFTELLDQCDPYRLVVEAHRGRTRSGDRLRQPPT